eukprot:CAMPEP_0201594212 /NCGR_PEP_ID=MMETSP0190_2-20130828/191598_1 /ASSEMBLY_ACC=CAM_ASM_000263 /TAXON_ID=37353 /ORGANISM="Rosalina sp." /LENGTH=538 /DNA_ID=CAMNT_0048053737 /DNA_START=21 /DNA_END=1634 /DNA_ORIENTATION=+
MSVKQPPQGDKAKDITLTKEETERLEECFKDKKFRDLLSDYVKEISNPKTKLAYEEYLKQVETEGGQPENRQLMKPFPEFCIKAKVIPNEDDKSDNDETRKKHIYINCCSGKLVKDAVLANSNGYDHTLNSTGAKQAGLCWQIPYILGLKRFDPNDGAIIYDVCFSSNTLKLSQSQESFKTFVVTTALEAIDGIEDDYKLYIKGKKIIYDVCFSSNTLKLSQSQESFKTFVVTTALEAIDGIEDDYKLYIKGKKWKILKSTKFKGNIEPPVMSVFVADGDLKSNRMVDTRDTSMAKMRKTKSKKKDKGKPKEMKYRIVESADKNIEGTWSDRNLLIEPLKRPKQIYITIKLENISGIKDIDCMIDIDKNKKYFIMIKVKDNVKNKNIKYKPCKIDLSGYEIIKSSMNASWYTSKQELKITFDIAPFTQTEVKEIQQKYKDINLNIHKTEKCMVEVIEEEDIMNQSQKENENKNQVNENEFLFKEVETKRIIQNKNDIDDKKEQQLLNIDNKEQAEIPLCHHKLPMIKKWAAKKERHYW